MRQPGECGCGIIGFVMRIYLPSRALSLIVIALALTAAACRGGTSEQKEQASSAPETLDPATPLTVEWTDADLEKSAERIGYGSKPDGMLARNGEGLLVFTPETDRDHVATRFTPLPAHEGERTLELVVEAKSPGGAACLANLQDQAFNVLATVPCAATGQQQASAKVPASVTGVRVYFLSAKREPLRLPVRMRLTEHR